MTPTGSGIPRLMVPCLVPLASGAAAAATAILEHRPAWTVAGTSPTRCSGARWHPPATSTATGSGT